MENIEKMEQESKIEITPYDTPWEIACMLINARHEREHFLTKEKYMDNFFDIDDLKRIGEHLINYCNTEKDGANG